MTESSAGRVVDRDGLQGKILRTVQQQNNQVALVLLEMENGRRFWAPWEQLEQREGRYYLPYPTGQLPEATLDEAATEGRGGSLVIPVLAETVNVGKRKRATGGVRVTKHVRTRDEIIEPTRTEEIVEVERVPVNREVAEPPAVRQEGDVTIVPILEEVLVVEKRLVLREELRITRRRREITERHRVTLRREEAEIEPLPGEPSADENPASANGSNLAR